MTNRLLYYLGRKLLFDGVSVSVPAWTPRLSKLIVQRLTIALGLIAERDPASWQRVRRSLPRIVVGFPEGGDAVYQANDRLCVLSLEYCTRDSWSASALASTIIHEATHARISRCGIAFTPETYARIERLCLKAELAFVDKLPSPERDRLRSNLNAWLVAPDEVFSVESFIERKAEYLAGLGLPPWFVNWLRRRYLAILRRQAARGPAR